MVSERLRREIDSEQLSGVTFEECLVTKSPMFEGLYQRRDIPRFYWMKIHGCGGNEDFAIANNLRLVVSPKALQVLESFHIENADIEDYID